MSPLTFRPLLKQYLWGGRRLGTLLGKPIGDAGDGDAARWAESWEVVDHGEDQSVVATGEHAGKTLGELVKTCGRELFGRHAEVAGAARTQFPLLFKFLDAQRTLSVQVHPNDEQAARLEPPDLGKTEAWIVLAADPGSKIYAGLKEGVDRKSLGDAIEAGACDESLHAFEPQVGDCVFIPAGTVHALGEGLVIAEIQQASNTTFRLFDWNRVDHQGQPRELHVEASLEVADYERGPVTPQPPKLINEGVQRLVDCEKFVLERRRVDQAATTIPKEHCFRILASIAGDAELHCGVEVVPMPIGQTVLIPAACDAVSLTSSAGATLLDMHLP